jgi:MinD superfamily P-loop ATPase
LALETDAALFLVDGPPGISYPVISASAGAEMALLVVEPAVSGAQDLERVLATAEHLGVSAMVVINKADLNLPRSDEVAAFCAAQVIGRTLYDAVVTEARVPGVTHQEISVDEYVDAESLSELLTET